MLMSRNTGVGTHQSPEIKGIVTDFNLSDFSKVFVFGLGCLFGLLAFSKILKYTFDNYRDMVIMVLSGLMLGSLAKIWPWRNPTVVINKEDGSSIPVQDFLNDPLNDSYKLISELNVQPQEFIGEPMLLFSLIAFIIGFSIVGLTMLLDSKKPAKAS